jgi:pilus assembly protein Flp/PilA
MRALVRTISALVRDPKAATAVEYGLIVSLIVIAIIAAIMGLANSTTGMWNSVRDNVTAATNV